MHCGVLKSLRFYQVSVDRIGLRSLEEAFDLWRCATLWYMHTHQPVQALGACSKLVEDKTPRTFPLTILPPKEAANLRRVILLRRKVNRYFRTHMKTSNPGHEGFVCVVEDILKQPR